MQAVEIKVKRVLVLNLQILNMLKVSTHKSMHIYLKVNKLGK